MPEIPLPGNIKVGVKVKIGPGTLCKTTGPRKTYFAKRATIVTVQQCYGGYQPSPMDNAWNTETKPTPPKIVWVGSGGYWCECDAQLVKVLP